MAPKLRQMALSFAPRAVLPDQRAEGAVVAIAADRPAIQAAVSSTGLDAAPLKKPRRELNLAAKNEILNFRKTHTAKETLAKFPEVSPSTLKRIQRHAGQIEKAYHSGRGSTKRKVPLKMYKALGETCVSSALPCIMLAASTAFADAAWLVPETLPLCVPFGPLPVNDPSSPVNDPPL